jgi:hypothetical protein
VVHMPPSPHLPSTGVHPEEKRHTRIEPAAQAPMYS